MEMEMQTKTLFFHGTTLEGRNFTMAGRFELDQTGNPQLVIGVALCAPKEQFVKKIGRVKAEGRALSTGPKGKISLNLYVSEYFEDYHNERGTFTENWFIGREIQVFTYACEIYSWKTALELRKRFSL